MPFVCDIICSRYMPCSNFIVLGCLCTSLRLDPFSDMFIIGFEIKFTILIAMYTIIVDKYACSIKI